MIVKPSPAAGVAVLLVLVAASCSSGSTSSTSPKSVTTAPPAATSSSSPSAPSATTSSTTSPAGEAPICSSEPEPGATTHELAGGGVESSYLLYLPPSVGPEPAPVVLDFHGLGSNGVQQVTVSRFRTLADDQGFVVVNPTGTPAAGSGQNSWELPQLDTNPDRDDIAWVSALLDDLGNHACVDPSRIYATGLSNGGFFSSVLVCELADRIAATSSVAGITHPETCEPSRPVPMLAFHGTADDVVPYGGGDSVLAGADSPQALHQFFAQSMPDELAQFATDFACSSTTETELTDLISRTDYVDCDGDVSLQFHHIEGDGHTWPGSILLAPFVPTTLDLDATQVAWDFFQQWSLPAAG
ncbi:MAG: prolyl oligopeptidase family serine peptidase [Actinomycetia bacterium]|nr:prolyl oligopeptidase family serine peptidase [Actinomycetes bacterium]MCP4083632.1 prolyl oligopeptidase family serine peptidase [Actinomycetes bacterium]